jgi:hypothetical protein
VLLRLAATLLLAAALAACGSGEKAAAPTTTTSDLPPGCSVDQVNTIVTDFLDHPTLAPPRTFEVYATYESDKRSFTTKSRARALGHLLARRQLGERSRIFELRVAKDDFNHARITFQLTRRAPDFPGRGIHSRLVKGAGTIDCAHQKVAAWVTKGP